jgi:hypothetical protein
MILGRFGGHSSEAAVGMWEAPNASHVSIPTGPAGAWLKTTERGVSMPKFVIERDFPKAGSLSPQQLQEISQKSCEVLRGMSTETQWIESYVTDDKIYCIYVAPDEDAVREHAQRGNFPANRISQVRSVIDPTTAD